MGAKKDKKHITKITAFAKQIAPYFGLRARGGCPHPTHENSIPLAIIQESQNRQPDHNGLKRAIEKAFGADTTLKQFKVKDIPDALHILLKEDQKPKHLTQNLKEYRAKHPDAYTDSWHIKQHHNPQKQHHAGPAAANE